MWPLGGLHPRRSKGTEMNDRAGHRRPGAGRFRPVRQETAVGRASVVDPAIVALSIIVVAYTFFFKLARPLGSAPLVVVMAASLFVFLPMNGGNPKRRLLRRFNILLSCSILGSVSYRIAGFARKISALHRPLDQVKARYGLIHNSDPIPLAKTVLKSSLSK